MKLRTIVTCEKVHTDIIQGLLYLDYESDSKGVSN